MRSWRNNWKDHKRKANACKVSLMHAMQHVSPWCSQSWAPYPSKSCLCCTLLRAVPHSFFPFVLLPTLYSSPPTLHSSSPSLHSSPPTLHSSPPPHCTPPPLPNPGEVSDLESQLSKGGLSVHELEKAKKRLEQEKEELTQSLEVCRNKRRTIPTYVHGLLF